VDSYTPVEKRLSLVLRIVALAYFGLVVIGGLTVFFSPPASSTAYLTPLYTNAVASLGLLGLLAWFASADVRRFRVMIYILLVGLALTVLGTIILYSAPGADTSNLTMIVLVGLVLPGLAASILTYILMTVPAAPPPWLPWMPDKPLTGWEQFGRVVCIVVGVASILAAVAHYILAYNPPLSLAEWLHQIPLVNGSAIKMSLLGLCLLVATWDVRRYRDFLMIFIVGNAVSLVIVLIGHLGINRFGAVDFPALATNSRTLMLGALLVDTAAVGGFILLLFLMARSLLDHTRFFMPLEFRALEAVAETLVDGGDMEKAPPEQIVLRTDDYLASFPSKRLWLAKAAILGLEMMPLMSFRPPISFLNPAARRDFIDRHFKQDIVNKRGIYAVLGLLRLERIIDFVEGMMRFNMQLTYIGYYSNPEVQADIGYKPFSQRPEGQRAKPIRRHPPLDVITPQTLRQRGIDTLTADVVIIGSGAGGAILAERLADQGREVLVVEKGPYVPPDEFTEDEVTQISKLYADGALQISQSLRFTVLQGSCVGGTTVVNNAVCFDTPDEVLDVWNHPLGANAGIDKAAFHAAQACVRKRLHIQSIKDSTHSHHWEQIINPGDRVIDEGVRRFIPGANYDVIEANILDCLGCGYCNIGCKYGRKLSMLDEVLPHAQQKHGDKFRILSEAEVVKLGTFGPRVTDIHIRLRDGRKLTIQNPKTVIVSAGTIASSWLLMRSGIGAGELPVGKFLAFNMGSPLHGLWDEELNSFAGLQIAHYLRPAGELGYVFETWYNPPIAQALAMPGWLDTHFQNMRAYNRMAAVGVLVGTEPTAYLTRALFLPGSPDIVYTPTERDMSKLVDALCTLGHIMFEGGAQKIFASTGHYHAYSATDAAPEAAKGAGIYSAQNADQFEADLRRLVQGERDILLGTGHPQGGNRMSKMRGQGGRTGGVIDPDFKVYGYDNLYVCDASVFPGATTVNPQLTVMTMAHYAADRIH
jgi:choline dehydrogenase-like flavoprotein